MQIDCEVLNTSLIKIKEKSVPENFKISNKHHQTTQFNVTNKVKSKNSSSEQDVREDRVKKADKIMFKPFFIDKVKEKLGNSKNEADYL